MNAVTLAPSRNPGQPGLAWGAGDHMVVKDAKFMRDDSSSDDPPRPFPKLPSARQRLIDGIRARQVRRHADMVESDLAQPGMGRVTYCDPPVSMEEVVEELLRRRAIRRLTEEERAEHGDDYMYVSTVTGELLRFRRRAQESC